MVYIWLRGIGKRGRERGRKGKERKKERERERLVEEIKGERHSRACHVQ